MAIDFPNSPTTGQTFTSGDKSWIYNGYAWDIASSGTVDHGILNGLADDDHTQYLLVDGTRSAASLTVSGDVAVNGGDLTTTAATFNFAEDATTINIGSTLGTSNIYLDADSWIIGNLNVRDGLSAGFANAFTVHPITGAITTSGSINTSSNITVGGTVDGRDIAADGAIIDVAVTSSDVDDIVEISQASYDALGSGRPANRLYLITS